MLCWMKDLVSRGKQRANQKNKTNVPLQVRSPFQKDKWFSAPKMRQEI